MIGSSAGRLCSIARQSGGLNTFQIAGNCWQLHVLIASQAEDLQHASAAEGFVITFTFPLLELLLVLLSAEPYAAACSLLSAILFHHSHIPKFLTPTSKCTAMSIAQMRNFARS